MNKYLIINADDFGISNSANEATKILLKNNKISSATLMPNVDFFEEAAYWAKDNCNNIGLHITLLNDDSKYKHRSLSRGSSIEDNNGFLYEDKNKFRKAFKYKDINKEIKLQFMKLIDSGIKISHVDTHRYSIYPSELPFVYFLLCRQCKKYGNLPMRWPRKAIHNISEGIGSLCSSERISMTFAALSDLYDIPIPDYVFIFPYRNIFMSYEEKKKAFIDMIYKLPDGISEVHIHPAVENKEIKSINSTWKERVFEFEMMMDEDIEKAIIDAGVELITYKDIKNLQNKPQKVKSLYYLFYEVINYSIKKIFRRA